MDAGVIQDNRIPREDKARLASLLSERGEWASCSRVEPLAGDGSDRRFYRVHLNGRSLIALISQRSGADLDEVDSMWLIGRHLASKGLPVARILAARLDDGVFLLEDLGRVHLHDMARRFASSARIQGLYRKAVELLARLHRTAPDGFSSEWCFDTPQYTPQFVLNRELLYFQTSFLQSFLGLEAADLGLSQDFQALAERAGEERGGLVLHRDFQSRNLMVHRGSLWVIDYQGMRLGPPEYDLASLLLDPYVMLPDRVWQPLAELYWERARPILGRSRHVFWERFQTLALCRCLQALAAYAFLGKEKKKSGFLEHIPAGWRRLNQLLQGPAGRTVPAFRKLIRRITSHAPSMERIQRPR
ncbi:hypothetical protein SAMN02746041_01912 [Desulfacinum hydrothermale DSM 13146]|uniref:Aminoglycoside phosphotransferase domain-containing protein n=1 Tax=Desulfacinum hydrothermale DSM 13146 TaxID=1121390 RepID=A0A1W1XJN8_9BACT|nr:phosphotransferase [Desulfacinum hydrothermale]SMC24017.1 hypothetical protein SAMN02746041_01912 [Desulfacinum hydrothermale DSM 13146]